MLRESDAVFAVAAAASSATATASAASVLNSTANPIATLFGQSARVIHGIGLRKTRSVGKASISGERERQTD